MKILDDWLVENGWMAKDGTGDARFWPVWDEVVVAHLLGLTDWVTYPRPSLKPGPEFDHTQAPVGNLTIDWIQTIDQNRLWQDFQTRLTKHIEQRALFSEAGA